MTRWGIFSHQETPASEHKESKRHFSFKEKSPECPLQSNLLEKGITVLWIALLLILKTNFSKDISNHPPKLPLLSQREGLRTHLFYLALADFPIAFTLSPVCPWVCLQLPPLSSTRCPVLCATAAKGLRYLSGSRWLDPAVELLLGKRWDKRTAVASVWNNATLVVAGRLPSASLNTAWCVIQTNDMQGQMLEERRG